MILVLISVLIVHPFVLLGNGLNVSFVSWNVKDNKDVKEYTPDIVDRLLNLKWPVKFPDVYVITFQENCLECKESHLERLSKPLLERLLEVGAIYQFLGVHATRRSSHCESIYCSSIASMHGTTLIMILVRSGVNVQNVFYHDITGYTGSFMSNEEKGIALIGFLYKGLNICFGGLHLDVGKVKYRQNTVGDFVKKFKSKCNVWFLGGDFNTRPQDKSRAVPMEFLEGRNPTFLDEMRKTDELSGSKPWSTEKNLLESWASTTGVKFVEPFLKPPSFLPTYSIAASLLCKDAPVCYEPSRYPSWTDRIIYSPSSRVNCSEYTSIPFLGSMSDHLPIYAICDIL